MANYGCLRSAKRTAKKAVYTLTVGGASALLMSASFAEGTSWFTRFLVLVVVLNGLATSLRFEDVDRNNRHTDDERGPSTSNTNRYDKPSKKSIDDEVASSTASAEPANPATPPEVIKHSVFPSRNTANEVNPCCREPCPSVPTSSLRAKCELQQPEPKRSASLKTEPTSATADEPTYRSSKQQLASFKPTTRGTFRPLPPKDDSILSRSKRFRRLEGKLAAGIWYEREYQKTKKLTPVFKEYDTVRKELLLQDVNSLE